MARTRTTTKLAGLGLAASLAAAMLPISMAGAKPVATPAPVAAANYLFQQLRSDGTLRATPGGPIQVGNTVQVALALKAAGLRQAQVAKAAKALATYVSGRRLAGKLASIDVGTVAYLVLLAHATGKNPRSFGGVDLVSLIVAQQRAAADPEAGLFGSSDPTFDGSFRQSLALQALLVAGERSAAVTRGFAWLASQQCPSGGFTSDAIGNPCNGRPEDWAGPDSNSTALAISAFAVAASSWPASGLGVPAKAWSALASMQTASGGLAYFPGGEADSNSTAQVVIAMTAAGVSAASVGLLPAPGRSPADALATFQVGGGANVRGFEYQPGFGADVMSTQQALLASTGRYLVMEP